MPGGAETSIQESFCLGIPRSNQTNRFEAAVVFETRKREFDESVSGLIDDGRGF